MLGECHTIDHEKHGSYILDGEEKCFQKPFHQNLRSKRFRGV